MSVLFLPKNSGMVKLPDHCATWEHISKLIRNLGDGIEVSDQISMQALAAIPTIWARPVLFQRALFDSGHPLHKNFVMEMRGLWGVLCLRDIFELKVSVQACDIPSEGETELQNALSMDPPFRRINLIYVSGCLVGCTSALSFAFTPSEYKCPGCIPWRNEKTERLDDPTVYLKKHRENTQLFLLYRWLEKIHREIGEIRDTEDQIIMPEVRRNFLTFIDNWKRECNIPSPLPNGANVEFGQRLPEVDQPYDILTTPVEYEYPQEGDFFLNCDKMQIEKLPIVVSNTLWKQFKKYNLVYSPFMETNINLNDIPNRSVGDANEISQGINYGGKFIRPELLFTKRILKFGNPLRNKCKYAFPLQKEVLDFFTPSRLLEMLNFKESETGVEVTLNLSLSSIKEGRRENRQYQLRNSYSNREIVRLSDRDDPIITLWPNFTSDSWKHYYCRIEPKQTDATIYEPYHSENPDNIIADERARLDAKISRLERHPESILCKDRSGELVGIIPIDLPNIEAHTGGHWIVSCDFGTSNTCVCVRKRDDKDSELLSFKNRCVTVTTLGSGEEDTLSTLLNFFYPEDKQALIPSHMRTFERPGVSTTSVLDALVLDVRSVQAMSSWSKVFKMLLTPQQLFFHNLKWTEDEQVRSLIKTFIYQLLLMIMAEAFMQETMSVELHYSYPSAFSRNMTYTFSQFWNSVVAELNQTGFNIQIPTGPETESVSICRYLVRAANATPASQQPQVVLDIGGGTTDIGIWMRSEIVMQTSLVLGGNVLAGTFERKQFRNEFINFLTETLQNIRGAERLDLGYAIENCAPAFINLLLNKHGETIARAIMVAKDTRPAVKRAISIIALMYGSIFFYIGLLLKKISSDATFDQCDIFFAGNGSRFLDWLVGYPPAGREESFKKILIAGYGKNLPCRIVVDRDRILPKQEVGRGLLYRNIGLSVGKSPSVVLGEQNYRRRDNNQLLEWTDDISREPELLKNLQVPRSFPVLETFCKTLNAEVRNLEIEEIRYNAIDMQSSIQQKIDNLQSDAANICVQSLFIQEVEVLLRWLQGKS